MKKIYGKNPVKTNGHKLNSVNLFSKYRNQTQHGMWGFGAHERGRLVNEMIRKNRPKIVILKETKLMNVKREIVNSLCHFENLGWIALSSIRVAGGVLLIWCKELKECYEAWVVTFSTSLVAAIKGERQKWVMSVVYGSTVGPQLEDFIAELGRIQARWELPGCMGDFNEVLYLEERNRAVRRI